MMTPTPKPEFTAPTGALPIGPGGSVGSAFSPQAQPASGTLSYGALCHEIEAAPLSWLAGIAACAVRTCVRRASFRSNDALMLFLAVDQCESPNAQASGTPGGGQ